MIWTCISKHLEVKKKRKYGFPLYRKKGVDPNNKNAYYCLSNDLTPVFGKAMNLYELTRTTSSCQRVHGFRKQDRFCTSERAVSFLLERKLPFTTISEWIIFACASTSKKKESFRVCYMSSERENLNPIPAGELALTSTSHSNGLCLKGGCDSYRKHCTNHSNTVQ